MKLTIQMGQGNPIITSYKTMYGTFEWRVYLHDIIIRRESTCHEIFFFTAKHSIAEYFSISNVKSK